MNFAIRTGIICAALLAPVVTFAQQSNQPVTRAQVRDDLQRLEQAGYNPAVGEDPRYPNDIQAAESRAAQTNTGIGGAAPSATQSGNQAMPLPTERPARPAAEWPQPLGGQ
ncbi:uncharacterized protein DUF4148 [Trinickia symbiotica]|uniref:DUF4148 domain-containing protein n=1 Tax=Trinickia symbiotica TaxID=863227 RepID=A0A2N7WVD9_9BURK|nr:DUF4148 domain-containing protein [Trinickia symbiotica]PMS33446.1 DUF4148 domain-containing protein [Trinickia symbiotica]PPK42357.1 uncharacterized protein DUF4148 [Trinickia symbiotica]